MIEIDFLNDVRQHLISFLFIHIAPSLGSYNPQRSLTNVVFPDPFSPTIAILSPSFIVRFILFKE